jgi:putative transposase
LPKSLSCANHRHGPHRRAWSAASCHPAGNHRAPIFFEADDYAIYRDLLARETRAAGVAVWAWCPMPNHVHLILTPSDEAGLAKALGRAHRCYAGFVNARARRTGHPFQERFSSASMA